MIKNKTIWIKIKRKLMWNRTKMCKESVQKRKYRIYTKSATTEDRSILILNKKNGFINYAKHCYYS